PGLASEARAASRPESGFEPPYTSFNIGTIAGGTAMNIIPRDCEFTWEFRPLPDEDVLAIRDRIERFIATDLLPRLRQVHPGADVATRALASIPGLIAQPARRPRSWRANSLAPTTARSSPTGRKRGCSKALGFRRSS